MARIFITFVHYYIVIYNSAGLVTYCCYNKLQQTWRCKTAHIYSYSSGGQKSKLSLMGMKSRCRRVASFWRLQGKVLFPCLFQFPHSLARGPASIILSPSASIITSLPSLLQLNLPLPASYKDPMVTFRSRWIIQDNFPILKFLTL